jgi:hypothetical protein
MRFLLALLRIIIFLASIIVILAVAIFSIGSVAIWLFLIFGARDVSIHGLAGDFLSRFNGLVFRQSDSLHYLLGSLLLLFIILPLSLALMEKLYFALYPEPPEGQDQETSTMTQDGADETAPSQKVTPDNAQIQSAGTE